MLEKVVTMGQRRLRRLGTARTLGNCGCSTCSLVAEGARHGASIPVWLALLSLRSDPMRPFRRVAMLLGFAAIALVVGRDKSGCIGPLAALVCTVTPLA